MQSCEVCVRESITNCQKKATPKNNLDRSLAILRPFDMVAMTLVRCPEELTWRLACMREKKSRRSFTDEKARSHANNSNVSASRSLNSAFTCDHVRSRKLERDCRRRL